MEFIKDVRLTLPVSDSDSANSATNKQTERNKDAAELAIIQAEKFKARVEKPEGRFSNAVDQLDLKKVIDDDEFVHVSCHVDENSISIIEKGQYIDLVKIKPKQHT